MAHASARPARTPRACAVRRRAYPHQAQVPSPSSTLPFWSSAGAVRRWALPHPASAPRARSRAARRGAARALRRDGTARTAFRIGRGNVRAESRAPPAGGAGGLRVGQRRRACQPRVNAERDQAAHSHSLVPRVGVREAPAPRRVGERARGVGPFFAWKIARPAGGTARPSARRRGGSGRGQLARREPGCDRRAPVGAKRKRREHARGGARGAARSAASASAACVPFACASWAPSHQTLMRRLLAVRSSSSRTGSVRCQRRCSHLTVCRSPAERDHQKYTPLRRDAEARPCARG